MKMKGKFFGLGAKLALSLAVVMGTMTSCYEKEDIKTVIDTTPKTVTYTISGSVYDYENLGGISGATLQLYKGEEVSGTPVVQTTSDENGGFSLRLTGLTNDSRGTYILAVSKDGYKDRTTSFEIWFENADNQTIASHMDFALKSNNIQGDVIKVVAGGGEAQTVTIKGSEDVADVIDIPANVFGAGAEPQTISIQRNGSEDEATYNAVRVYEGKPDGTVFTEPLVFTFTAASGLDLKVYYLEGGVWTIAENGQEEVELVSDNGDGTSTYRANIYHFSTFKFAETDYTYSIDVASTVVSEGDSHHADLAYHNSSNEDKSYSFQVSGLPSGAKYETPLEEVFASCPAKEVAISYFEEWLLANNYTELPGNDFKNVTIETEVTVPAHSNLTGAATTEIYETNTYTMTIAGASYTVTVVKVNNYTIEPETVDYTHGHGIGHGHGHGDDLNAGGGIIDFE